MRMGVVGKIKWALKATIRTLAVSLYELGANAGFEQKGDRI